MIVIQTTLDRKAMTALARITRRTLRRGRNGPVRMLAWFVVVLETFLTWVYIRGGQGGWPVNMLLAVIMLACILTEDQVNGMVSLRQILPASREVNATFRDSGYVHRAQSGESWWPYHQIRAVVETEDYFVLLLDRSHGHIYDKQGFAWGTPEEFRELIHKRTGLKIQKIR